MDDGYLGEIRLFAGNFAPLNWAFCDGQMLSVANYAALYSLFGNIYGGDGRVTFALPDFRGRTPIGTGQGPGLSHYLLGQKGGQETVGLGEPNLPAHIHQLNATEAEGNVTSPTNTVLANSVGTMEKSGTTYSTQNSNYNTQLTAKVELNENVVTKIGGTSPHYNLQPILGLNYIICTEGYYPPRH